jgi:hypothetical protein
MLDRKGNGFPVENRALNLNPTTRFEKGDFSSYGYPFEDNEERVYLGDKPNPHRLAISLKYAFYYLANAPPELLREYSLVHPLVKRKGDPVFRRRLEQGLLELFSTIKRRVLEVCNVENLRVETIALSIPSQWTLDFEDTYRRLIAKSFDFTPENIYFHTETEALAHFLFKKHFHQLGCSGKHDMILFLDFGGHNMNGCIFNVVYGRQKKPAFYRVGDAFGVGGGSEHWEYKIGEMCATNLQQRDSYTILPEHKQKILDEFNRAKLNLGPGNNFPFSLVWLEEDGTPTKVVLPADKVNRCFEEALNPVLDVAREHILNLSSLSEKGVHGKVVISGRTCRNNHLQAALRQYCLEASLGEPIFTTDKLEVSYE